MPDKEGFHFVSQRQVSLYLWIHYVLKFITPFATDNNNEIQENEHIPLSITNFILNELKAIRVKQIRVDDLF